MADEPYMSWTGLAAMAWDPSGGDEPGADHDYIKSMIERGAGPALDVGCGTGRLLLRYLKAGLDVDGVEVSADMLSICRAKAAQQGLEPRLYQQSMHALDLPRKYRTIFIPCGSFVLLVDRQQAWDALYRIYDHLEPGGAFIFNMFWVFGMGEPLSIKPLGAFNDWGPLWTDDLPDGGKIVQHVWIDRIDRVEQLLMARRRYRLVAAGKIVQEEIFESNERWYFKHEIVLMLERVGYRDVQIKGEWTDEPFADTHDSMVLIATK